MADPFTRLARRVAMALGLGRQSSDTNETANTPTLQVTLPGGEVRSDVPLLQHYGFHSRPVPGSDVLTVFMAGDRTRGVAVATGDQRGRITDLKPGEVCVYHPRTGSKILLAENGDIEIVPASGVLKVTAELQVDGSIKATGDIVAGEVSLQNHLTSEVQSGQGTSGKPVSG